jgi:hypothetical protein
MLKLALDDKLTHLQHFLAQVDQQQLKQAGPAVKRTGQQTHAPTALLGAAKEINNKIRGFMYHAEARQIKSGFLHSAISMLKRALDDKLTHLQHFLAQVDQQQ